MAGYSPVTEIQTSRLITPSISCISVLVLESTLPKTIPNKPLSSLAVTYLFPACPVVWFMMICQFFCSVRKGFIGG